MYNHVTLREIRSTFLREHCPLCSGKVYRYHLQGRTPHDDNNGSELIISQIHDRCSVCQAVHRRTTAVPWPLSSLEEIFQAWEAGRLSRAQFDFRVTAQLRRAHGRWA